MKYIAAYLLLQLGGNEHPSAKDIAAVLKSVGIEVDNAKADKIVNELKGKAVDEVIAKGRAKLGSMPAAPAAGGAAPAAAAAAAAPSAKPSPPTAKKEEKKVEKVEEPAEDDDMGFGLFD